MTIWRYKFNLSGPYNEYSNDEIDVNTFCKKAADAIEKSPDFKRACKDYDCIKQFVRSLRAIKSNKEEAADRILHRMWDFGDCANIWFGTIGI